MNVKGYIHGKETNGSVSPHKGDKSNSRLSRQAVAGKARVGVPPTRLNGLLNPASSNPQRKDRERNGTDISHHEPSPEQQELNGMDNPGKHGDMFDTDVEGIDDSTIASGSVVYADENQSYQPQPPTYQGEINRGFNSQSPRPQNITDLRGWANKLASELPSDSEESGADDEQATQRLEVPPVENKENFDVNQTQEYGSRGTDRDTASSRIEAALREASRRPVIRQPYPMPSLNRESLPPFSASIAPPQKHELGEVQQQQNYNDQPISQQTSQSPAPIPIRGRFNKNHRLVEPYPFQYAQEKNTSNPAVSGPQANHVLPNPDVPPTPSQGNDLSPEKTIKRSFAAKSNAAKDYARSKSFDLTDLSALDDSSDSSEKQETPAPHRRSNHVAKRPKRPFDTYNVDYPTEVLLSKPFSELKSESFDFNPSPPQPTVFPTEKSSLSLAEKLPLLKTLNAEQRRNFFSSLTINQWEESGDWLIDQFSSILQNVKDARHERRKVASVFEKEIERRYEDVEGKSNDLDKRLEEMKTGGLEVLKGRASR